MFPPLPPSLSFSSHPSPVLSLTHLLLALSPSWLFGFRLRSVAHVPWVIWNLFVGLDGALARRWHTHTHTRKVGQAASTPSQWQWCLVSWHTCQTLWTEGVFACVFNWYSSPLIAAPQAAAATAASGQKTDVGLIFPLMRLVPHSYHFMEAASWQLFMTEQPVRQSAAWDKCSGVEEGFYLHTVRQTVKRAGRLSIKWALAGNEEVGSRKTCGMQKAKSPSPVNSICAPSSEVGSILQIKVMAGFSDH